MGLTAVFILLGLTASANATLPEQSVILSADAAPKVIRPCSRNGINNVTSYWTPTSTQIWSLEGRLPVYLAKDKIKIKKSAKWLSGFYRQYVGVIVGGKRLIYGNFFPGPTMSGQFEWSITKKVWKKEPVDACDGGSDFWGIVFDVGSETFSPPVYSGTISGPVSGADQDHK